MIDTSAAGSCVDWFRDEVRPLCFDPLGLKTLNIETGDVETLLAGNVQTATWSPDGTRVAFIRDQRLGVLDVATGEARVIAPDLYAAPYPSEYGRGWGSLAWSPDGRRIAFADYPQVGDAYHGQASVCIIDADGGNLRHLLESSNGVGRL